MTLSKLSPTGPNSDDDGQKTPPRTPATLVPVDQAAASCAARPASAGRPRTCAFAFVLGVMSPGLTGLHLSLGRGHPAIRGLSGAAGAPREERRARSLDAGGAQPSNAISARLLRPSP